MIHIFIQYVLNLKEKNVTDILIKWQEFKCCARVQLGIKAARACGLVSRARARQRSDLYGAKPRPERYKRREGRSWNGNSLRGASNMSVCGTVRWENAATWQNSIAVKIACRTCRALCTSRVVGECVKTSVGVWFLHSLPLRYTHTRTHTWIHIRISWG